MSAEKKRGPKARPAKDRFLALVRTTRGGCWIPIPKPYGDSRAPDFRMDAPNGKRLVFRTAAWLLFRGKIPAGRVIWRTCDSRFCCNPDHLRVVSRRRAAIESIGGSLKAYPCGHPRTEANTHKAGVRADGSVRSKCATCNRKKGLDYYKANKNRSET